MAFLRQMLQWFLFATYIIVGVTAITIGAAVGQEWYHHYLVNVCAPVIGPTTMGVSL